MDDEIGLFYGSSPCMTDLLEAASHNVRNLLGIRFTLTAGKDGFRAPPGYVYMITTCKLKESRNSFYRA
jgi:hypothetical protein